MHSYVCPYFYNSDENMVNDNAGTVDSVTGMRAFAFNSDIVLFPQTTRDTFKSDMCIISHGFNP